MKTSLYLFLLVLITGMVSILLFPYYTVNPGVLIEDHIFLQNDCLSCHSLGSGAATEKCMSCHKPGEIGLIKVNRTAPELQNEKSNLLHQSIINIQCYDCHTEHNGLSEENATLNFKHSVLSDDLQNQCTSCHLPQKPGDEIHKNLTANCSLCHNSDDWRITNFEHSLPGELRNDCRGCHENKKPIDALHNKLLPAVQCAQCHTTDGWKPSTFNHIKFFRFDRNHPSDCRGCHDLQKGFKEYTCYNCHEHRRVRVAKKHRKEGIRNFENCVSCHRTGDEDDAKRERKRELDDD